ncbi:hypothetical protein BaRGS_00024314 [Batillaria attramentaria]|uniref:Nondiscriminating glutamyl-tRNA synthetase EARS2, mitochondrial n=1 Tax=Batillaria attramentaria TaxID=370345 RepID=A0ABD0KBH9_9CAEN
MAASMRKICFRRLLRRFSTKRKGVNCLSTSQDASSNVRVRFAPSPTGYLHLGGLRTALYNFLFAKSREGTFVLRIEDTDQSRLIPDALDKLEKMLEWSGLVPDEGPSHGGKYGPYIQSLRIDLYQESIKQLLQNGTAYHCFCTPKRLDLLRRDSVRRGETPRYDNRCRHLEPGVIKEKLDAKTPYVVRLKLEPTPDPWDDMIKGPIAHNVAEIEGDPVILKSDGFPTYHFANVVDDHYMGISHVLRGDEWIHSTPKHLLLYKAFGWSAPRFAHLPLIVNQDGTKLSKRQGDIHIEHFRDQGYLPEAVVSYVTTIGGGFKCNTASLTLDQLVQHFDIERVKSYHSRLDPLFLEEANRAHLMRLMKTRHAELVASLRSLFGSADQQQEILTDKYLSRVLHWSLTEDRISKLTDLVQPKFAFLWETPQRDQIQMLRSTHTSLTELLTDCTKKLQNVGDFEKDGLAPVLREHAKASGLKTSVYMHLMREVLSGLKEGPPVAEMMSVMGKDNTLRRIHHTIHLLQSR